MGKTEQVLSSMLQENTGRHMLDSGGAYGRHWEANQGRNFDAEPASTVNFKYGIEVTHNVYHYLKNRLNYSNELDSAFAEFADRKENEDTAWLALADEFVGKLTKKGATGLYGDGKPMTINTYNGEDLLSQTLQYIYFELNDSVVWETESGEEIEIPFGTYALLQIHNGCDVRGGYTKPRGFEVAGSDETALFDNARATIYCTEHDRNDSGQLTLDGVPQPYIPSHTWDTDDAYNWYREGSTGYTKLNDYDRKEIESKDQWEEGVLCVDQDYNAYCPICGGKLDVADCTY